VTQKKFFWGGGGGGGRAWIADLQSRQDKFSETGGNNQRYNRSK